MADKRKSNFAELLVTDKAKFLNPTHGNQQEFNLTRHIIVNLGIIITHNLYIFSALMLCNPPTTAFTPYFTQTMARFKS